MKAKRLFILLAAMSLVCVGCKEEPENEPVEAPAVEKPAEEESEAGQEETADAAEYTVNIESVTSDGASDPADKEHNYEFSITAPVITVEGNADATKKIQDNVDEVVNTFTEYVDGGEFGMVFEEMGEDRMPSSDSLSYTVLRADSRIISIMFKDEGYDQGAHGWCNVYYRNFYTATGETVTFDSLGAGFREKAVELVKAQVPVKDKEMSDGGDYSIFFEDYEKYIPLVVADGTEKLDDVYTDMYGEQSESYGDDTLSVMFGITDTGFVFTSGQYAMQSYASGIIDFDFSKDDFGDVLTADIF